MRKPIRTSEEVQHWPLVLGVLLLVSGSILYWRIGNRPIAVALAVLAVVTPLVGFVLRAYLSRNPTPRVRRVKVDFSSPSSMSNVPLESVKYMTPPSQSGLREADELEAQRWLRGQANCG